VKAGPTDLVLCAGTLRRDTPFRERVAAASIGGFSGMSLWGRHYQQARDEGLSERDITLLLADHGLSVAELDPAWWWLPGASEVHIPAAFDSEQMFGFEASAMFDIAAKVGARSLNAVDVFGGTWTLEEATAAFGALCRQAAESGLLVQLEFLPWSRIPDLATAWQIVREAGEPNGGIMLDAWHYDRSSSGGALLRSIPGARILGIQLSDGPAEAEADLLDATLHHRLLPGEGEFDLSSLVDDLRTIEADAPFGVEVFSDALHAFSPNEAARAAGDAMRRCLGRA
jgi:sugar phosphate isomerase/epimerase